MGASALAMVAVVAACSSSKSSSTPSTGASSSSSNAGSGGPGKAANVASFALPPATVPNWIWPFAPLADFSVTNAGNLQALLYRPLYWFGDDKGGPLINPSLSVANPPKYSADGKTITITLKPYVWSNGEKVTAQDVVFWINMEKAEKANYAAYVAGTFPDDLASVTAPDASTVVLTTKAAYSQQWFTYNELGQITPMPMAWDVTGPGKPGTCATDVNGCKAVWAYLNSQAKDLPSYASSPIWTVVDGPWKLKSFNSDGHVAFVPNPTYAGPIKATLKEFDLVPYTTDTAEFNVLRAGSTIDVGFIPTQDISKSKPAGSGPATAGPNPIKGYDLAPLFLYGVNYFPENFNNPKVGAIFKQLYFRQALQSVVDQNAVLSAAAKGYGVPTTGPVPLYPDSPLVSTLEKNNPYPFSISAAKKYLSDNGWNVTPNGVTKCAKPGTAAGDCGAGITAGEPLTFDLQFSSGNQSVTTAMSALKSDAAQVGITLNLSQAPFNSVIGTAVPCSGPKCTWQMQNWGGGWAYSPDYYPTGESIFQTGAGSNSGSYSNPAIDKLIVDTNNQSGTAVMQKYEDALSKDLPVIWQPNYTYSLTEIAGGLQGVNPQNPFGYITPEQWHWSK